MKTVLHLTCDFPDPMVGAKTKGVVNYIDNTQGYRHVVYSLNRASWRKNIVAVPFGDDRTAVAYGAPPKGIMLATRLRTLGEWIMGDLESKGITPDVIHAHKLSVEGLLAHDLHAHLGAPYICSIWGDTDLKIMRTRRDLRSSWEKVLGSASRLLPVAPWAADRFVKEFGADPEKMSVLLPIVGGTEFFEPAIASQPRLVTLFNLDAYKRKNLLGLIHAVRQLRKDNPALTLDIFGAGGPETLCDIDAAIEAVGAREFIKLQGRLPAGAFETTLNSYTAFVMPTSRETFGMVFVEALFCGLPVLYTKGWSIDGLFPPEQIGYAWNGREQADIERGLRHLMSNEEALKHSIRQLEVAGEFDQFKKPNIIARYASILDEVSQR